MVRNVLASWAGYMVFIVTGFLLPRLIDRSIGATALGVWDFGWAMIHYFSLMQLGVVASVNRFVAKHRAVGDTDGVRAVASSACILLIFVAVVVLALTVAATIIAPSLLSEQLQDFVGDARWVIFMLGASLAAQMGFAVFAGILSGCHRWVIKTVILSAGHLLTMTGMIVALLAGYGLRTMATITLIGETVSGLAMCIAAYRIYPELRIRLRHSSRRQARRMLGFGGKNFVLSTSRMILSQTASVLIVVYLGPASLAIFSRPYSLVRSSLSLIVRLSHVLTPTTSSLQATGRHEEIQGLLIRSTRYSAYIALPIVLTLAILGGPILVFWMGPAYGAKSSVLAILAVGHLSLMIERPARNVLSGLNAHGRPAIAGAISTLCVLPMLVVALKYLGWGLNGAALMVTASVTAVYGIYVPICACRQTKLSLRRYVRQSLAGPVLCAIPYALCLLLIDRFLADRPATAILAAGAGGVVVLAPLYWRQALPPSLKRQLSERFLLKLGARAKARA